MMRAPPWTLLVASALALFAPSALATELQTGPTDPNAPPPPPPPMPPPGQPGSATPPPPPGSTAAHLDQSSTEDTGVGLHFVYLQPEIGVGFATLGNALPNSTSLTTVNPGDYRSGVGPVFGAGVGGEFITFQLGGRFRALTHKNFNLYNIGGELNYQPGSGRFWPRIGINAGYVWAGSFNKDLPNNNIIDISGFSIGARAGLQYFVTSNIEIGGDLTAEALLLRRPGVNGNSEALAAAGTGTGAMLGLMGHIGFHYP